MECYSRVQSGDDNREGWEATTFQGVEVNRTGGNAYFYRDHL